MNILDENGESYFVTAFDHSTQEQGTATSKDAFTGGDINASLTQEVVELRKEVIGHGTDQLLYLAGKDGGLVSNDLVDIAVFQDPGIERITLACDTVVEGNDTLLEALYHRQIRMAAAQLQDIDGKAANVNDIGDGMSFQRAELGNGSRKCLGIAEYLADPDRVVLSVILKIHDLASAQEVLLETAVQLLIYSYFRCSVRTKENRCELKQVPEAQVEAAVLQLLQEHISAVVELDRCLSEIQQVPYQKINVAKCEQRREKLAAEIARYRDLKASLYEDMKEGLISKTDFCDIRGQYDARIADALIAQEQIDRELSIYLSGEQSPNNWMKTFTEHRGLKSLTRAVVLECIEKVVIHKDEKLEIIFEHSEDYARLVSSLQEYAARGILGEAM